MSDKPHLLARYILWCYVAMLAAVAALSTAEDNWISTGVVALAMVTGLVLERYNLALSRYWRTPLGFVALTLFVLDFLFYSRGVILTISHVIVMTTAIYLITEKCWADWLWLFSQGVMLLSAAGVAAFEMAFMFYAIVFLLASCLFGYHIMIAQASDGAWRAAVTFSSRRRARSAAFAALTVVAFLAIGAATYVLIPRVRPFGFTTPFLKAGQPVTGFSPEVTLDNGIGNILEDSTPVFRAQVTVNGITGESPLPLYWRGSTVVYFTGNGWRTTPEGVSGDSRFTDAPLRLDIVPSRLRAIGPVEIRQSITLERLSADAMFALPGLLWVSSPIVRAVQFDLNTCDIARIPNRDVPGPFVYNVTSQPPMPSDDLEGTPFSYNPYDDYVTLARDTNGITPRMAKLAQDIAGDLDTPYERALAIRDYLRENYAYSTVKVSSSSASPVDEFLFETKKGHCEYFASALALLLRAVDVPTRVVNGFLGGEYNSVGLYYTVREYHAHSWTEVYFVGKGWYTFDATPEAEATLPAAGPSVIKAILDYMKYRWLGQIVGYGTDSQRRLYSALQAIAKPVLSPLGGAYDRIWDMTATRHRFGDHLRRDLLAVLLAVLLAIAAVFFAAAVFAWLWRAGRSIWRARRVAYPWPAFYRRFVRILARRGFVRQSDETPLEVALRAAGRGAIPLETAYGVVEAYYRQRFAGVEPSADEIARIESLLDAAGKGRP